MRLIEQKAELLPQEQGIEGLYRHIERCGRICYKSEDKITEDSAKKFVDMLIERGHTSVLEHGTVLLSKVAKDKEKAAAWAEFYSANPFSDVSTIPSLNSGTVQLYEVVTNLRVLIENNRMKDLKYLVKNTDLARRRCTFKIITSRSVSHELVRHRAFSFSQESQRYVNYGKDTEGILFIMPVWLTKEEAVKEPNWWETWNVFYHSCKNAENDYMQLLQQGESPQKAREVLTNSTKTELCMTGTIAQWKEFFKLRSPKYGATGVHPMMADLADKIYAEMIKVHLI